jgi:hypothetical protein
MSLSYKNALLSNSKSFSKPTIDAFVYEKKPENIQIKRQFIKNTPLACSECESFYWCDYDGDPILEQDGYENGKIEHSAMIGHIKCIKSFYNRGYNPTQKACQLAGSAGKLDALKLLHKYGCKLDSSMLESAAFANHFDCVKYAIENNCFISPHVLSRAGQSGNLELVKYLYCVGKCKFDETFLEWAEDNEIIKWALKNGSPVTDKACQNAGFRGDLELVKVMIDKGCELSSKLFLRSASSGNIELLEYLHENKCKWNELIYGSQWGILSQNTSVLDWAFSKGYQFITNTKCKIDMEIGEIEVENQCEVAVKCGNIIALKWLHEKGCKLTINAYNDAVRLGQKDICEYIEKNMYIDEKFKKILNNKTKRFTETPPF